VTQSPCRNHFPFLVFITQNWISPCDLIFVVTWKGCAQSKITPLPNTQMYRTRIDNEILETQKNSRNFHTRTCFGLLRIFSPRQGTARDRHRSFFLLLAKMTLYGIYFWKPNRRRICGAIFNSILAKQAVCTLIFGWLMFCIAAVSLHTDFRTFSHVVTVAENFRLPKLEKYLYIFWKNFQTANPWTKIWAPS